MSNSPLVSVLIPVYNREKIVGRAIESALAQTYDNIEIIICDNASSDGTWGVMVKYAGLDKRIKIFRNSTNVGPVRNWQECLKHADGEYIKFLWSDDTIEPSFVETLVNPLIEDNNLGFSYCSVNIILESSKARLSYLLEESKEYDTMFFVRSLYYELNEIPVSPGCAIFRKKDVVFNLVTDISNPYHLDFSRYGAGNDVLLFLEACASYKSFYYCTEPLATFYGGKDSFSIANNLSKYYNLAFIHFILKYWKYSEIRRSYCQQFEYSEDYKKAIPLWHTLERKLHWRLKIIKHLVRAGTS